MRQKAAEKKNWLWYAVWALLVMVLISTRLVCGLYARYTVSGSGEDGARVAAFAFSVQDQESSRYLDISKIQKPGDSQTYTFTVTNQKGSAVSEVAQSVRFTLWINGSMPLKCTISGEGRDVLSVNFPEDTQVRPVERTESVGVFPPAEATSHTYTMTVEWPAAANDSKYASRSAVAEVLLTVTAEQID